MTTRPKLTGVMTTSDGRRAGFVLGDEPMCVNHNPHPHVYKHREPILNESVQPCEKRFGRGGARCGALLYVWRVPQLSSDERLWLVCEVTRDHTPHLSAPLLLIERLVILGLALPGVEEDLTFGLTAATNAADDE